MKVAFDLFVIVVVLAFIIIPVVKVLSLIWRLFTSHRKTVQERYAPFPGSKFEVTTKEFDEIRRLKEWLPNVTNKFCKARTLIVYFTVQRKHHLPDRRSKKAILQLCKIAVLQELNYGIGGKDPLYGNYVQVLDDKHLCEDITTEAHKLICRIAWEDEAFYNACTDAWEIYYFHLRQSFKPENVQLFYDKVCGLAERNNSVMAKRKMYIGAYQLLVGIDREYSLRFYLHYLCVSVDIKYRRISIKNSKVLFRKQGEKECFDTICHGLLQSANVSKALEEFDRMGISQRKKITLNVQAIKTAVEKQSEVASVLGEWLAEDEVPEINKKPKENLMTKPQENLKDALFQLFVDNSYRVDKEKIDSFVRSCGLFTSQFVERINDEHFEELDDVLIEEDEECYILNEAYCQQIKENGY